MNIKKTGCLLLIGILLLAAGCRKTNTDDKGTSVNKETEKTTLPYTFEDSTGKKVTVKSLESVVVLYGSFAELWIDAGGTIKGTTQDAIDERKLELGEDVSIVGTVKEPNLEEIIALNPTFIIMSADITSQGELDSSLTEMGIPHAYMQVDTFDDYLSMLKIACDMTGRDDLFKKNGTDVEDKIDEILEKVPDDMDISVLLLRAYSTGAKAKTDDNFTGIILKDLNTKNIADKHPSLLEDLSIEEIITEDPDYIFVVTMGAEEKALEALESGIGSNPAWKTLSAVKNDRFIVLPKDLFHYKPNSRWAESYEYVAKIIYPEVFGDDKED